MMLSARRKGYKMRRIKVEKDYTKEFRRNDIKEAIWQGLVFIIGMIGLSILFNLLVRFILMNI